MENYKLPTELKNDIENFNYKLYKRGEYYNFNFKDKVLVYDNFFMYFIDGFTNEFMIKKVYELKQEYIKKNGKYNKLNSVIIGYIIDKTKIIKHKKVEQIKVEQIKEKPLTNIIKLLDDVDKSLFFDEYYCANIVEKLYECNTKLIYKKNGGCGLNYKYCSKCYEKWFNDKSKKTKKETKCLIDINKL